MELHNVGADVIFLRARTNQSLIRIAEAARTRLYCNDAEVDGERRSEVLRDVIKQEIDCTAAPSEAPAARLNDTVAAGNWPR